jgi:hypothetical protein
MIADTRKFGNMTQLTANQDLREELKAVKAQAKALTYSMDFLIRQISFDEGEFKKWDRLRDALIDFEELEVNSGTPVMVMIPPERLTKLNMAYGPKVGDAINKMIDDLTVTDTTKQKEPQQKSRFKKALDQIQPKVQPLAQ